MAFWKRLSILVPAVVLAVLVVFLYADRGTMAELSVFAQGADGRDGAGGSAAVSNGANAGGAGGFGRRRAVCAGSGAAGGP